MRKRRNIYSIPNELNNTKQKSVEEIFPENGLFWLKELFSQLGVLLISLKIKIFHWSLTMELPRGFRQPKRV